MNKLDNKTQDILKTYNSIDLIAKFGALNLSFENQNKEYLTSYVTVFLLWSGINNNSTISGKSFRRLVDDLNNKGIMPPIQDPPEYSFFDTLLFDKEYHIFNGVNEGDGFFVSRLIELITYLKTPLPSTFICEVQRILKCLLEISEKVFKGLKLNYEDIEIHGPDRNLYVPPNIDNLSKLLFFDKKEILRYISEEEFKSIFLCVVPKANSIDSLLEDKYPFYFNCPFLDCGDNVLLIDPTVICHLIKVITLKKAKEHNCLNIFLDCFNNNTFDFCLEQISVLCQKSRISNKSLTLINDSTYKEAIIPLTDNKIIIVMTIFYNDIFGNAQSIDCYDKILSFQKRISKTKFGNAQLFPVFLICSFGVSFSCSSRPFGEVLPIVINVNDIEYIRKNEMDDPFFLVNFAYFLKKYGNSFSSSMSAINIMGFLKEQKYDIHIRDDINLRNTNLFIGFEYTYTYRTRSKINREQKVINYPFSNVPLRLINYHENVFFPYYRLCRFDSQMPFFSFFGTHYIAYYIEEKNDKCFIIETLSYWFNELKSILENELKNDFYLTIKYKKLSNLILASKNGDNLITIFVDISKYESFANNTNEDEKELVISCLRLCEIDPLIETKILQLFNSTNKKYKYKGNPRESFYELPLHNKITPIFENKIISTTILDEIGDHLLFDYGLSFGKIDNPQKVTHDIVAWLFEEFATFMSRFDWKKSAPFLLLNIENYTQQLALEQTNLKNHFLLFPNEADKIQENYNNLNAASCASRFILEYLETIRPDGFMIFDSVDLQYCITLIHTIIMVAHIDDGISSNLITEISFLKSGRLGFDKTVLEEFNKELIDVVSYDLSNKIKFNFNQSGIDKTWPFLNLLNEAYLDEYGYMFDTYSSVILSLVSISDFSKDLTIISKTDLIAKIINNSIYNLDEKDVLNVINDLIIHPRSTFFDKKILFRDLYPWRYNRRESLNRKPIIEFENEYMWGNRLLYHSLLLRMDNIAKGKELSKKPGKGKINVLNGKVLSFIGNEFNNKVYEHLVESIPEMSFFKEVKSINNKRITDDKKQFLGDIDILGIDRERGFLVLIEVKDYFYARNICELSNEIKGFFGDEKRNKRGFLEKCLKRKEWVEKHINDVVKEYKLESREWKIKYTFLSNKPLISNALSENKFNNVSLKEVSYKYFKKLK